MLILIRRWVTALILGVTLYGLSSQQITAQNGLIMAGGAVALTWEWLWQTQRAQSWWQSRWVKLGVAIPFGFALIVMFGALNTSLRNDYLFPFLVRLSPQSNILAWWNISDVNYQVYEQVQSGQSIVIFNPRTDASSQLAYLGVMLNNQQLSEAQQNALAEWRRTKQPQFLKQAGVTHLYIDETWLSYTTPAEYQLLQSPHLYQLELSAYDPSTEQTIYLYRVLGANPS